MMNGESLFSPLLLLLAFCETRKWVCSFCLLLISFFLLLVSVGGSLLLFSSTARRKACKKIVVEQETHTCNPPDSLFPLPYVCCCNRINNFSLSSSFSHSLLYTRNCCYYMNTDSGRASCSDLPFLSFHSVTFLMFLCSSILTPEIPVVLWIFLFFFSRSTQQQRGMQSVHWSVWIYTYATGVSTLSVWEERDSLFLWEERKVEPETVPVGTWSGTSSFSLLTERNNKKKILSFSRSLLLLLLLLLLQPPAESSSSSGNTYQPAVVSVSVVRLLGLKGNVSSASPFFYLHIFHSENGCVRERQGLSGKRDEWREKKKKKEKPSPVESFFAL